MMVDYETTHLKRMDRAGGMVGETTGPTRVEAEAVLKQPDYGVKPAILMVLTGLDAVAARLRLDAHQGFLRAALEN